jgi:NAD(P)-dependent dehydrogenase (short-subunit alcohol dehydrogenase family)
MENQTVSDKKVLVTGGAGGIGAASAIEFARVGYDVSIADIDAEKGEALARSIGAETGRRVLFVQADFSKSPDVRRAVEESADRLGGLDVLFNNVGIQPPRSYVNAEGTSEELWDLIIDVNLKSHFLAAKYAIPHMRAQGGGVIINNASVQGLQSMRSVPAYAASKGGVLSLTRQLAVEYASEHIRILAVCPGTIDTDLVRTASGASEKDLPSVLAEYGRTHPLQRIGTATEVADVVVFLASERASFMTGEYVCVDGGYMALGAWAGGAGST